MSVGHNDDVWAKKKQKGGRERNKTIHNMYSRTRKRGEGRKEANLLKRQI
jgi:hypothetical protein